MSILLLTKSRLADKFQIKEVAVAIEEILTIREGTGL